MIAIVDRQQYSSKMFFVSTVRHRTKSRASKFVFLCVCFNLHRIFINSKFISPLFWLIRETERLKTLLLIGNIK